MSELKFIPVFSAKLAGALMQEGAIVDHMADNKENPSKKVYYFRYFPGIYELLNAKGKGARR